MRTLYAVLGWGIVGIGVLHMASSPSELTSRAVWFFSGGIAMVLTGALNLLTRTYGATAPGLRWVCIATNAFMTAFALLAGSVSRASIAELVTIGGWLAATTVLSLLPSVIGRGPRVR